MTRVTIVGAGNMGRGIGTRVVAGGHQVEIVGRDPADARHLAETSVAPPPRSIPGLHSAARWSSSPSTIPAGCPRWVSVAASAGGGAPGHTRWARPGTRSITSMTRWKRSRSFSGVLGCRLEPHQSGGGVAHVGRRQERRHDELLAGPVDHVGHEIWIIDELRGPHRDGVNSLDQQGLLVHRHGSVEPDDDVIFSLRLRSWGYDTAANPRA